jgi:hypothetical protein
MDINAGLVAGAGGLIAAGIAVYVMLYAMGFFQYLGGKKRPHTPPVGKSILIERLLDLNDASKPYCIMRGADTDLVAEWKIADADWYGVLSRNGLKQAYRALLLVDEYRHSVRCCEELGSVAWTVGLNGPILTVSYTKSFFRGRILYNKQNAVGFGLKQVAQPEPQEIYEYKFDVNEIRGPLIMTVEESGWEWVPVTARRHATYAQPPQS